MSTEFYDLDELPAPPRKDIAPVDRQMLELAAHAVGAVRFEEVDGQGYADLHFADGSMVHAWNPLVHSDDTLNIMSELCLDLAQSKIYRQVRVSAAEQVVVIQPWGDDKQAAIRLAVTRAAAMLGKKRS